MLRRACHLRRVQGVSACINRAPVHDSRTIRNKSGTPKMLASLVESRSRRQVLEGNKNGPR